MPRPAVWENDPDCGHDVANAYQTHYCTYIRAPRLLSLQAPRSPDDLLLITAHQWYELWFKVLRVDLEALRQGGLPDGGLTLLQRGLALFELMEQFTGLAEELIVRDLGLRQRIRTRTGMPASSQFRQILTLARRLPRPSGAALELRAARREYTTRLRSFRARYQKLCRATLQPVASGAPTYAAWLCLPELLDLQPGVKAGWAPPGQTPGDHWRPEQVGAHENMFIVVHQCFEVWFKVCLDHIDRAIPLLFDGQADSAHALLHRVARLQRLLVTQIQVPATMQPADFFEFRHLRREQAGQTLSTGLSPASGTESYQFREIEIVSGLRDDPVFREYLAGTEKLPIRLITPRQRERLQQPTLLEAFEHAVRQRGVTRLEEIFPPAGEPNPHADLARLADALVEFDEFFRFWRLGHLSMVEKMIGARTGTGFLGPEYLRETAGMNLGSPNPILSARQFRPRFFETLWEARSKVGGR